MSDVTAREPIREAGTRLLTIPRQGGRGKPAMELRVVLDEFEGHKFIGLRLWEQGSDRNFYPTPKGVTIRPRELYEVIRALCLGAKTLGIDLHPKAPEEGSEPRG